MGDKSKPLLVSQQIVLKNKMCANKARFCQDFNVTV